MSSGAFVKDIAFSPRVYQTFLQTSYLGRFLTYIPRVESTMMVSANLVKEGASHGTIVVTEEQTKGVGRLDRQWSSPAVGNLYFTLVVKTTSFDTLRIGLPAASVAVTKACRDEGIRAHVKWPNDVWVGGKKVCGMIMTSDSQGGVFVGHIGIGVNVNQDLGSSPDLELRKTATSLCQEAKRPVDREAFLARVMNHLEPLLALSVSEMTEIYRQHDMLMGQTVTIHPKRREDTTGAYQAKVVGIAEGGYLQVELPDGSQADLSSEEVSVRLAA